MKFPIGHQRKMSTMKKILDKMHDIWETLVFWVGDIRSLSTFPWVTWAIRYHKVHFGEIHEASKIVQPGDIGVHRDDGYLSNVAIPGFQKHAWIHIEGGDIVEAISEGVVRRDMYYPLYSDYAIIFRPKNVTQEEIDLAVTKAKSTIGENYDVDFNFDIETEVDIFRDPDSKLSKGYGQAFSCTEVVSFSWWHKRDQLNITRSTKRGKEVVLADDFFNDSYEIAWMSESVTMESARDLGLHPTGQRMISEYRNRN